MRRCVALASRPSDKENVQSRLSSSLKTCVNCELNQSINEFISPDELLLDGHSEEPQGSSKCTAPMTFTYSTNKDTK